MKSYSLKIILSVAALLFSGAYAMPQSSSQPTFVEFDKALFEAKDLKRDIAKQEVTFEQVFKADQLRQILEESIASLKVLKAADRVGKLSNLSKVTLNQSLQVVSDSRGETVLNVEQTAELQSALFEIIAERLKSDCNNESRRVSVVALRDNTPTDGEFEVMFALVTEYPSNVQRMKGGQRAPVEDRMVAGLYFFWTQDPNISTRRGERKYEMVCHDDVPLHLPVPIP